ncbi:hypothetical protein EMIHUDRAFT_445865, partial [Emiliania huxleyi CCMP1516]|uniref:Uncharacterized protein n=2 Tax=Emiliania huxleyi TaxID=2903 RepID=A0A0D3IQ11_EMIH1
DGSSELAFHGGLLPARPELPGLAAPAVRAPLQRLSRHGLGRAGGTRSRGLARRLPARGHRADCRVVAPPPRWRATLSSRLLPLRRSRRLPRHPPRHRRRPLRPLPRIRGGKLRRALRRATLGRRGGGRPGAAAPHAGLCVRGPLRGRRTRLLELRARLAPRRHGRRVSPSRPHLLYLHRRGRPGRRGAPRAPAEAAHGLRHRRGWRRGARAWPCPPRLLAHRRALPVGGGPVGGERAPRVALRLGAVPLHPSLLCGRRGGAAAAFRRGGAVVLRPAASERRVVGGRRRPAARRADGRPRHDGAGSVSRRRRSGRQRGWRRRAVIVIGHSPPPPSPPWPPCFLHTHTHTHTALHCQ